MRAHWLRGVQILVYSVVARTLKEQTLEAEMLVDQTDWVD